MDIKEQGSSPKHHHQQEAARNTQRTTRRVKRELRQTTKSVQAVIAILVSIGIAIFAAMSPSSSAAFTLNKRLFNPTTYARIRTVWFGDLPTTATTAPPALARKWFGGGPASEQAAFDHACTTSFRDALAALGPDAFALPALNSSTSYAAEVAHGPSIAAPFARELADAVGNASDVRAGEEAAADAALGLVLLLDQVSRNVFRGADQALVYAHYDRIARSVARLVLEGKPRADLHPKWRASPAYRLWFYMPLMHSEFVQDQRRYEEAVGEVLEEVERGGDTEAAEYVKRSLEFGKKHRDILERFGRYPHRNDVLGRKMTKEEREWLEAGGETFGTKK